ncbi:MAG: hypothetical protein R2745_13760 [Vicinamibacterales bacterium]
MAPSVGMRHAAEGSLVNTLTTWAVLLALWAAAAAPLLGSAVGHQALVDERVRASEAAGGTVTDAAYAAWQARPPYWIYLTSGGRALLTPVTTLLVALGLWLALRPVQGFTGSLGVAVHATTPLVIQQVAAAPLHAVRESLTSPFNLAALLPFFDEGTLPARFLGAIELFGVWWVLLLAAGCAALTGKRARAYVAPLLGIYAGLAAAVAAAVAISGGS